MTKKSKLVLAMASMLGITAGATAVSGFAWFTTTKTATINVSNIGVYSASSNLAVAFGSPIKGCEGSDSAGTVTVKAKGQQIVQNWTGDASTDTYTLTEIPHDKPTITVGGTPMTTGWTLTGTTLTFDTAPADQAAIQVSYYSRKVLTDVSSIDGVNIYKPIWTATGEGRYAGSIDTADHANAGYLSFTMTVSASGSSALEVFANNPTILGVTDADTDQQAENNAAAEVARVAVIADDTTRFVLQKTPVSPNNVGISEDNLDAPNWDSDGVNGVDGWDLSQASGTTVVPTLTGTASGYKNNFSSAPAHTNAADIVANNYITHVDAGGSKTIKIVVWLEGTNFINRNDTYGAYANDILDGVFNVNLPLIAF